MNPTALYYALSTIAQCAAALAALIGFLGLWRLDRLEQERAQDERDLRGLLYHARFTSEEASIVPTNDLIKMARSFAVADLLAEQHPSGMPVDEMQRRQQRVKGIIGRWDARKNKQKWLMRALHVFLFVTLVVILAPAIVGLVHVDWLKTWPWTPTLLWIAAILLAGGPIIVVWIAARLRRTLVLLVLPLALASPALAGPVQNCTTYEQKTMNQLYTVCDDGTRAVSTWNQTLSRWESTVTPPPGQTCTGQLNPRMRQWEGRCR